MAKKPVLKDENGYRKFGIRDSVAYAAGDLGCNMSFALKGTMALFWTQVMGMGLSTKSFMNSGLNKTIFKGSVSTQLLDTKNMLPLFITKQLQKPT